jgi:hypothetical protein
MLFVGAGGNMKQNTRKLRLERETLIALTDDALGVVNGGAALPTSVRTTQLLCPSMLCIAGNGNKE